MYQSKEHLMLQAYRIQIPSFVPCSQTTFGLKCLQSSSLPKMASNFAAPDDSIVGLVRQQTPMSICHLLAPTSNSLKLWDPILAFGFLQNFDSTRYAILSDWISFQIILKKMSWIFVIIFSDRAHHPPTPLLQVRTPDHQYHEDQHQNVE